MFDKTIVCPNTEDIEEWLSFISENRYEKITEGFTGLVVNCSAMEYIYTFQLVSLSCLIEEYFTSGIAISFKDCNNTEVQEYLDAIKFFNYWDIGFNRIRYTEVFDLNCFCLWKIHFSMIDAYVNFAKEFAERHWGKKVDFSSLHICLAELFNNIKDHSKSQVSGYVITQNHPTHEQLRISVCDFGIGISKSVREYSKEGKDLSSSEALVKAFEINFSTSSQTSNRGLGLDNLKENVTPFGGELKVYTNEVALIIKNDNELKPFSLSTGFSGTLFDIIIDTNSLEMLDDDVSDEMLTFL